MIDGDVLHEEEEGYFASMTDIMVGLLFIFIIIIMFFALQISETDLDAVARSTFDEAVAARDAALGRVEALEQALARAEAEIDRLRAALDRVEADRMSRYLAAADDRRTAMLHEIRDVMREAGLEVEVVEEQGVVRLPNDLLFASGRFTIDDGNRADEALRQLGTALARVLPCYTRGPRSRPARACNPDAAFVEAVFVEGHTDAAPVGGSLAALVSDNLGLSARRAETTYRRLVAERPDLAQFLSIEEEPVLNVAAYGETRPIRGNGDFARNRRIDVRLLMHTPRSDTLDRIEALVADGEAEP